MWYQSFIYRPRPGQGSVAYYEVVQSLDRPITTEGNESVADKLDALQLMTMAPSIRRDAVASQICNLQEQWAPERNLSD